MNKRLIAALLLMPLLFCSKNDDSVAGTGSEVNTGEINGSIRCDGSPYTEEVLVVLHGGAVVDSAMPKTVASGEVISDTAVSSGEYAFQDVEYGTYSIEVLQDSVRIGLEEGIVLNSPSVTINITVVIVINQYITINVDSSRNVTVVNVVVVNGTATPLDSGYSISFADSDTQAIQVEVDMDGQSETVDALLILQPDGSYAVEIAGTDPPIDIVIPGPGGASSTVTVQEPGSQSIEAVFDTTGVPR